MTLRLALSGGGEAEVVHTDGQQVTLLSPRPAPTGATLVLTMPDDASVVQIKVRNCRRAPDDSAARFSVDGRFVSLGKTERQRLLATSD